MTDEPTERLPRAWSGDDAAHPSPDAVADHTEGLLPEVSATAVAEHLTGCASCRALAESLDEVRRLLTGLPDPGPMPPDVVARIDAGLAAAAGDAHVAASAQADPAPTRGLPAETEPAESSRGAGTVVPLESRRRTTLRRSLQVAAAVVLLGGGAALVGPSLLGSGSDSDTATPTAAEDSSAGRAERSSTEAPAAMAGGAQIVWLTSSGVDHSASTVPEAARGMLAREAPYDRPAVADERQQSSESPPDAAAPLSDENVGAAVSMCARTVGATPLAIDAAEYDGRPAWVVIRPGEGNRVEAWVVPPGCPLGETLYFANVPTG